MGPHMSPNIGPYPRHHLQSLFATIFRDIILSHISPPLFSSMDFRGPWGDHKGVFDPFFGSGDLSTISLRGPNQ